MKKVNQYFKILSTLDVYTDPLGIAIPYVEETKTDQFVDCIGVTPYQIYDDPENTTNQRPALDRFGRPILLKDHEKIFINYLNTNELRQPNSTLDSIEHEEERRNSQPAPTTHHFSNSFESLSFETVAPRTTRKRAESSLSLLLQTRDSRSEPISPLETEKSQPPPSYDLSNRFSN